MDDNQAILKRAESLSMVRRVALTLLALSVFGVAGALIMRHVSQSAVTPEQLDDIRILSQGLWFVCLMAVVIVNRRIRRDPLLKSLINDERANILKLRSFAVGFWVFMVAVVGGIFAAIFLPVDPKPLLLLILCLGGTAPAFSQTILSAHD